MTDKPNPTAEAMKRALAAKKGAQRAAAHGHSAQLGGRGEDKAMAAKSVALAKPAFRKASKRG